MDVIQRLAHARALARIEQAQGAPAAPVGSAGLCAGPVHLGTRSAEFQAPASLRARLERHAPLPTPQVQTPARPLARSPAQHSDSPAFERREHTLALDRRGARPKLLGACLDRLDLPSSTALARDLICLGAERGTRPAVIDLESTGLGGTSMAFVIGVAWPEDGQLRVVQWVLNRVGGEAEMLAAVFAELRCRGADPLVSFNGASFDLPLLRLRANRHRLVGGELDQDHVDLLHPARRLYRGSWADCRLGTLERELLGLRRQGDIEGAEIPEVFWASLRDDSDRARARMQAVCEHNLVDLVSLPAIAARLAGQLRVPDNLDRARRAARHWLGREAPGEARRLLSRWVEPGMKLAKNRRSPGWREAALELATLERRAAGAPRAARLWEAAWHDDPGCPAASEAWAKYLEHHAGDFARALEVAGGSRLVCPQRLARLERRLERARAELGESAPGSSDPDPRQAAGALEPDGPGGQGLEALRSKAVPPRRRAIPFGHEASRSTHPETNVSTQEPRIAPVASGNETPAPEVDQREQRTRAAALSVPARSNSTLLTSVEDDTGVRLRYRLLR